MFGQQLRELRKRRGFSQAQLAAAAGVRQTYISALERGGRTNPSREVLQSLARVLGVPLPELAEAAWRDRAPLGEQLSPAGFPEPELARLQVLWPLLSLGDRAILLRLAAALVHESALEEATLATEEFPRDAG